MYNYMAATSAKGKKVKMSLCLPLRNSQLVERFGERNVCSCRKCNPGSSRLQPSHSNERGMKSLAVRTDNEGSQSPGLITGHSMWDLFYDKDTDIIPFELTVSFHHCSTLIHLSLALYALSNRQCR
jgi:hypothetical protein